MTTYTLISRPPTPKPAVGEEGGPAVILTGPDIVVAGPPSSPTAGLGVGGREMSV